MAENEDFWQSNLEVWNLIFYYGLSYLKAYQIKSNQIKTLLFDGSITAFWENI